MTDKQLLRVTKSFTKGLIGKRPPKFMCYAVCLPLEGYLRVFEGIKTELIEGVVTTANGDTWQHFWLQLPDGRIVDPTASQFAGMPEIYLGALPENYTAGKNADTPYVKKQPMP